VKEENDVIAIIVVAYNRPVETRRLIESITNAYYDNDAVDLVVSVDKGPRQEEIIETCKELNWNNGKYQVIQREKRLGLRPHILLCGEMTKDYDGVIVLEDDLVVSPIFYRFAKNILAYYGNDSRVAQISLYSYAVNEFVSRPFCPEKNEFDAFAMKVTQSWGGCWSNKMWAMFMQSKYYSMPIVEKRNDLPDNINNWGENSWKKNFSNYLVETDRFVIYPYVSYTTNYTIAGEHCKMDVPDYHVVLQKGNKNRFDFCGFDECIKYDQFFERMNIEPAIPYCTSKKVCIDLYGSKHYYENADILMSTAKLPYKVIESLKIEKKPHEENLLTVDRGKGIFVYDLSKAAPKPTDNNNYNIVRYDVGCIQWRKTFIHFIVGLFYAIRNKLKI